MKKSLFVAAVAALALVACNQKAGESVEAAADSLQTEAVEAVDSLQADAEAAIDSVKTGAEAAMDSVKTEAVEAAH